MNLKKISTVEDIFETRLGNTNIILCKKKIYLYEPIFLNELNESLITIVIQLVNQFTQFDLVELDFLKLNFNEECYLLDQGNETLTTIIDCYGEEKNIQSDRINIQKDSTTEQIQKLRIFYSQLLKIIQNYDNLNQSQASKSQSKLDYFFKEIKVQINKIKFYLKYLDNDQIWMEYKLEIFQWFENIRKIQKLLINFFLKSNNINFQKNVVCQHIREIFEIILNFSKQMNFIMIDIITYCINDKQYHQLNSNIKINQQEFYKEYPNHQTCLFSSFLNQLEQLERTNINYIINEKSRIDLLIILFQILEIEITYKGMVSIEPIIINIKILEEVTHQKRFYLKVFNQICEIHQRQEIYEIFAIASKMNKIKNIIEQFLENKIQEQANFQQKQIDQTINNNNTINQDDEYECNLERLEKMLIEEQQKITKYQEGDRLKLLAIS